MEEKIQKAKILLDVLPYIKKFHNKTIVIKYGGSAQNSDDLKEKFARDIVLISLVGIKPIIVHGGGKSITEFLDRLNIKTSFIEGQRVSSLEVLKIAEMVLLGDINKQIVSLLNNNGARAIGLSGKDAGFIKAEAKDYQKWGYTGEIKEVNEEIIFNLLKDNFIPVIAPIASSKELNHPGYNINADLCASQLAISIKADKLIFLTDTIGVLDKDKKLISNLNKESIKNLKEEGTIVGGMIPKLDACFNALTKGVKKAHIVDGRIEHSILLELFTSEGIGTQIV